MTEDNLMALANTYYLPPQELRETFDLDTFDGVRWLRLLMMEMPTVGNMAGWCASCKNIESHRSTCYRCDGPLVCFDEAYWSDVGTKIKAAVQNDHALIRRVKAEAKAFRFDRQTLYIPSVLAWVRDEWDQAVTPEGRPFDPITQYKGANCVHDFRELGFTDEEIVDLFAEREQLPDGPVKIKRRDYAGISGKVLREMRDRAIASIGHVPASLTSVPELWRTMAWVKEQRENPLARLNGERPRAKRAHGLKSSS